MASPTARKRPIITEMQVRDLPVGGKLVLPLGALLTPMARQVAFERRIELLSGDAMTPPRVSESTMRSEIVRIGGMMYQKGFIVATDGNISARLGADRLLTTPSGLHKGFLNPAELIVTDMDGSPVRSPAGMRPTSEMPMHLEVYRQRPDVNAVVHAHLPVAVTLSIAGIGLDIPYLPEAIVTLGPVPTTEYATPASRENVGAIRDLIGRHDVILLRRHGSLAVGVDLFDAFMKTEAVEHKANIVLMLQLLGQGEPLPPDQVSKLLAMRRK